jgi:hypothetical protein
MNMTRESATPFPQNQVKNKGRFALVLGALALTAVSLSAGTVTYTGEDLGVGGSGPLPNSTAAYNSFYGAASGIGNVSLINFESSPLGSFSSLSAAPGVTVTGTDFFGNDQTIRDTTNSPAFPTLDGSNTTPGGANFVEVQGGTLVFSFASPISFFGAFLTGVQDFTQDTINFSDGTSTTILIPEAGTSSGVGAVDFVGFTDAGKSISSVTVFAGNTGFDDIGVDDVSYQSAASPTPEPGSVVLMLTGCLALGLLMWQRRSAQAL